MPVMGPLPEATYICGIRSFYMKISSLVSDIEQLIRSGRFHQLLDMARDEKDFNRLLASSVGGDANTMINGVEADVLRGTEALEVKIKPERFFYGFCQAVALEEVAGIGSASLLHIVDALDEEYLSRVTAMRGRLGIRLIIYSLMDKNCVII